MARLPEEELTHFISDMYSVELQALAQLETAPDMAGYAQLAEQLREHYSETEWQADTVRTALQRRGGSPSAIKNAIMRMGGKGFLLFAKMQPETPGKLAAHAYSYEAMEWAGYQLLERMATRLDDLATARMAKEVGEQERAMMHRLEDSFDAAEEASHAESAHKQDEDHLIHHLTDAHALEKQIDSLLRRHEDDGDHEALDRAYRDLHQISHQHAGDIQERLVALGSNPSTVKDSALAAFGINWSMFFSAQNDTPAKLAAFIYALEHLKIAGYELLLLSSKRTGDEITAELCRRILHEKRTASDMLVQQFDEAVSATFAVAS